MVGGRVEEEAGGFDLAFDGPPAADQDDSSPRGTGSTSLPLSRARSKHAVYGHRIVSD